MKAQEKLSTLNQGKEIYFCGFHEPVLVKEDTSIWEKLLSVEFSMQEGSESSEAGDQVGEGERKPKNSESGKSEQDINSTSKLDIDSLEKKGWKECE